MLEFTGAELLAIRAEYCKGATDTQFELFISECKARNLRPGPHVIFQLRNAKEWDADTGSSRFVKKPYWITTIGALRLIALRTGQYDGSSDPVYIYLDESGDPSIESKIPLPSKENRTLPREPWAVRVSVRRKDFSQPITSVVRFDSVAATQKRDNTLVLTEMWQKRGDAQNAKCSEADALRKAFPEELGSLYLSEEIKNEVEERPAAVTPASVVPLPPTAPPVDQKPAEPTNTPRPGEKSLGPNPEQDKELERQRDQAVAAVIAAVPSLKPASDLPTPEKKKPGRKPKNSPDNGRDVASEGGISDKDIEDSQKPQPVVDEAANQREASEFVDSVTNFTESEAAAQGLPDPPEYSKIPEGAEKQAFIDRARKLPEPGCDIKSIGDYMLKLAGKVGQQSNKLTVGDWTKALEKLEEAKKSGTLPEFLKGVQIELPVF